MNAVKHFIVNDKQVSEAEFIQDTLLSCYPIYSVLKDEDVQNMNITDSLNSIKLLQRHLDKLEGLDVTGIEKIKIEHYRSICEHCRRMSEERYRELRNLRLGFIVTVITIIIVAVVCFILRG